MCEYTYLIILKFFWYPSSIFVAEIYFWYINFWRDSVVTILQSLFFSDFLPNAATVPRSEYFFLLCAGRYTYRSFCRIPFFGFLLVFLGLSWETYFLLIHSTVFHTFHDSSSSEINFYFWSTQAALSDTLIFFSY